MTRKKAPVPTPKHVKPEDKQMRQLKSRHAGKRNGHAKPRVTVGTAAAKALGIVRA